jgi:hypothetical protein
MMSQFWVLNFEPSQNLFSFLHFIEDLVIFIKQDVRKLYFNSENRFIFH